MRYLATFCFAFAAGIFAAQYWLQLWLLPCAAAGCLILGALWSVILHGYPRRRAAIIGVALALGLCWDYACARHTLLPFEALTGTQQTLTMETADYPSATEGGCRVEVRVDGMRGKALYYGDAALLDMEPGTRLTGAVRVSSAASIRGDGVSTFTSRGIFARLYAKGEATVQDGNAGSWRYLPQRMARRMQESIAACFPERTQAFMNALLLGDKFDLSPSDKTNLSEAGLYHITAVSGLHCAFLLAMISFCTGLERRRLLCALAIPTLAFYALVVGLTPSVVRACVMLTMMLIGPLYQRESDAPTSLSLAVLLILAVNPFAVKSVSLQLSFFAMLGLILVTQPIYDWLHEKEFSRVSWFFLGSLSATAGALAFSVPLTAFYFGNLVLIAPLSNLLCLWAASLTFAAGLGVTALGMVFQPLARLLGYLPHLGAAYLLTVAEYLTKIPYHAVYFADHSLRLWLVYVFALFGTSYFVKRGKHRYLTASALSVVTLALVVWLGTLPMHGGSLHLVALDIGQGQSVVLHAKGVTALVDCGSSSYVDAGDVTADYLQSAGIRAVDYVILSHYHNDHCNGLTTLLTRVKVKRLVLPDIDPDDAGRAEVLDLAKQYSVPVSFVHTVQSLPLGGATLTVYPPVTQDAEMNEECLSVLCSTGSFDALFTGDMDADSEYRLIATNTLPDVEVLMVGHHGSRYSTGGDLLSEVTPETALISCGENNSYDHPHNETLYRLENAGAAVYRTDLQGNIHITVN